MQSNMEKDCDTLKNALKTKGEVLVDFILSKKLEDRLKLRENYKA